MKRLIMTALLLFMTLCSMAQSEERQFVLTHCGQMTPEVVLNLSKSDMQSVREWLVLNGWVSFDKTTEDGVATYTYDYHPTDGKDVAHNYVRVYIIPYKDNDPKSKVFSIMMKNTLDLSAKIFLREIKDLKFNADPLPKDDSLHVMRYSKDEDQILLCDDPPGKYTLVHVYRLVSFNYKQ